LFCVFYFFMYGLFLLFFFFFFNDTATTEIYTLSLHDALPIFASHFLWKMVRRLVGTLVRVGWGELPVETLRALLAGEAGPAELAPAEWTAPASGLFLERVLYRGDPPLLPPVPVTPLSLPPR